MPTGLTVSSRPAGLPAEEAVGVEAGTSGGKDVQEGVDGGGRVAQVQNYIYQLLWWKKNPKQQINILPYI